MRLHLLPRFGRMKLEAICAATIDTYGADPLRGGYGPKSFLNHLAVLRAVLMLAQR